MELINVSEHNRRIIQEALDGQLETGGTVNVDTLPLIRVDGRARPSPRSVRCREAAPCCRLRCWPKDTPYQTALLTGNGESLPTHRRNGSR